MSVIVVIPARGGSKGIPHKNMRHVGGQTLLSRCIHTCRRAKLVDEVIVSSECQMIGQEAELHNAHWMLRPAILARDETPTNDVLSHVLSRRPVATVIALAQCTAPLMTSDDVDGTIRALENHDSAAAFIPGCYDILYDRRGKPVCGAIGRVRRQDRQELFKVAGSVFAARAEGFESIGQGRVGMHMATHPYYLEIDELHNLAEAEALLQLTESEAARKLQASI